MDNSIQNYIGILRTDVRLKDKIHFPVGLEISLRNLHRVIWDRDPEGQHWKDDTALRHYIEKEYGKLHRASLRCALVIVLMGLTPTENKQQ